jgi:hypothetical protein
MVFFRIQSVHKKIHLLTKQVKVEAGCKPLAAALWGGFVVSDPIAGKSFDIPSSSFRNLPCQTDTFART